ncbi:MAG: hypothetical protein AAGA68_16170 [Pseudomonadota bacterium]
MSVDKVSRATPLLFAIALTSTPSTTALAATERLDLVFPLCQWTPELSLDCSKNPYTAGVYTTFDHDGEAGIENALISAFNRTDAYCRLGVAVNGVLLESRRVCGVLKQALEDTPGNYSFLAPFADDDPFPQLNYLGNTRYVGLDGHPGTDYELKIGDPLVAAQSGVLCALTGLSQTQGGDALWTNPELCPFDTDEINGGDPQVGNADAWHTFNTFYVVDPVDGHSSWYLHARRLSTIVDDQLREQGYAQVEAGDLVAFGGDTGTDRPVLQFELREPDGIPTDPYGLEFLVPAVWADAPDLCDAPRREVLDTAEGEPLSNGLIVDDNGWLMHRFEVTESTQLNRIGICLEPSRTPGPIKMFAAVVPIASPGELPPADLVDVDFAALELITLLSAPISEPRFFEADTQSTLDPGYYTIVFGTGALGADSVGESGFLNVKALTTDLAPDELPVTARPDTGEYIFQLSSPRLTLD